MVSLRKLAGVVYIYLFGQLTSFFIRYMLKIEQV